MSDVRHPERIFATVNGASTRLPDGGRQLIGGWCEDPNRDRVLEYVRADLAEALVREIRDLRSAIGEWSRPAGANGMTMPSKDHPLLVAKEKARITLADYEGFVMTTLTTSLASALFVSAAVSGAVWLRFDMPIWDAVRVLFS